jgi:hypothetical protein
MQQAALIDPVDARLDRDQRRCPRTKAAIRPSV